MRYKQARKTSCNVMPYFKEDRNPGKDEKDVRKTNVMSKLVEGKVGLSGNLRKNSEEEALA